MTISVQENKEETKFILFPFMLPSPLVLRHYLAMFWSDSRRNKKISCIYDRIYFIRGTFSPVMKYFAVDSCFLLIWKIFNIAMIGILNT